jgi:hypothetical protein
MTDVQPLNVTQVFPINRIIVQGEKLTEVEEVAIFRVLEAYFGSAVANIKDNSLFEILRSDIKKSNGGLASEVAYDDELSNDVLYLIPAGYGQSKDKLENLIHARLKQSQREAAAAGKPPAPFIEYQIEQDIQASQKSFIVTFAMHHPQEDAAYTQAFRIENGTVSMLGGATEEPIMALRSTIDCPERMTIDPDKEPDNLIIPKFAQWQKKGVEEVTSIKILTTADIEDVEHISASGSGLVAACANIPALQELDSMGQLEIINDVQAMRQHLNTPEAGAYYLIEDDAFAAIFDNQVNEESVLKTFEGFDSNAVSVFRAEQALDAHMVMLLSKTPAYDGILVDTFEVIHKPHASGAGRTMHAKRRVDRDSALGEHWQPEAAAISTDASL